MTVDNVTTVIPGVDRITGSVFATYDLIDDSLTVIFDENIRPHVTDDANAWVSVIYDIDSGKAFGWRVKSFLAAAVHQWEDLMVVANYFGLIPREPSDFRLYTGGHHIEIRERDHHLEKRVKFAIGHLIDVTGGPEIEFTIEMKS